MNITDFSLKLNGYPLKKAKNLVEELCAYSLEDREAFLVKQKQAIVDHHLKYTPFYKSLVASKNCSWEELPILTKQNLQIPLSDRLSNAYNLNNCYTNKTSGSSGNPFYFAKDKMCHAITWAIFDQWYGWHDIYSKPQARFYGIPKEKKSRLKERLKDYFSNRYRFNVFDLSDNNMQTWLKVFSKRPFEFITGYTTVIIAFAEYLLSQKIVLKDICPSLKVCLPTSEICSESDQKLLQQAFGIPVYKEYGAAEFGLIALERDTMWVLNNYNLYVEIVDDNGNILPHGETGRIVITDLFNKAHPFIRYDIGDIGEIDSINEHLVLKNLIGRKEDYVLLPSGKKSPGLSLYYVTKSVMKDDGHLKEIKVTQESVHNLRIDYVSKTELTVLQKEQIQKALDHYLEPGMTITFKRFTAFERNNRGKLKQFTSLIR